MGEGGACQCEGVWGGGGKAAPEVQTGSAPPGSVTLPGTAPAAPLVGVWLSFLPPNPLLYNILVYFTLFLGSLVIFKWEKYCKRNF